MGDDGWKIIELRLPTERPADELGIGHDLHRIAGAARCIVDPEVDACDSFDRVQDFKHRKTTTVTAIERHRPAASAQMNQCVQMSTNKIADMNVIPNAGAVGSWVIIAENLNMRP